MNTATNQIFGNIFGRESVQKQLDNAIEETEASNKRYISLKIETLTQRLDQLTIINSCDNKPKQNKGILVTHKKDALQHGIGLNSVKKVVEKYNGLYSWDYDEANKTFATIITLPKQTAD